MSDFLDHIHVFSGNVTFEVPAKENPLNRNIWGSLFVESEGYVYAPISKPITWIKFLGLSLGLPFMCAARKCQELFNACRGRFQNHSQYHSSQLWQLTKIAWQAVLGGSLRDKVVEFSKAEISYHQADKAHMEHPRSWRFARGHYLATCMQPLFHKYQYNNPQNLQGEINALNKKMDYLEAVMKHKEGVHEKNWLKTTFRSVAMNLNPYKDFSYDMARDEWENERRALDKKCRLLDISVQCKKYAVKEIMNQQPIFSLFAAGNDDCCGVQGEATCFNQKVWRQEKICGIFYKIDCCATRCWAMNCCGVFCCLWPDADMHCCVI